MNDGLGPKTTRTTHGSVPATSIPHTWLSVTAGRICEECKEIQLKDHYDDATRCIPMPKRARGGDAA